MISLLGNCHRGTVAEQRHCPSSVVLAGILVAIAYPQGEGASCSDVRLSLGTNKAKERDDDK
ncbi:hypothetical protein LCGC14_1581050 [marine sediment metagenome]|uniref:Uncharacterized protein n=1 Tax=marine sediment metagenome TaxID=412755 RepID=A0A0F9IH14_9ZZZZ